MNRLWVRLTLAFALVILITVGAIALLANLTAGQAFRRYLSYSDTSLHQNLIDVLTVYYEDTGSWEGVEGILSHIVIAPRPETQPMPRRRPGTTNWPDGAFQIVVAGADGRVVYDNHQLDRQDKLTRDENAAARDIELDGVVIGKLVIAWPMQRAVFGPLEEAFEARLQSLLLVAAVVSVILGVLLGLAFSRSLTAPLQNLASAAQAIAERDFSHRLEVKGTDEMAEVANSFNNMASKLEQSERQRQNMVADVAHELRTPLSVVQGNLRAILDDVYPLDKTEVSRVYDESRLLGRLVDDLRELAQADAGQLRLEKRPVHVAPVIQSAIENLALAAEAQQVDLLADIEGDFPAIDADPDRLAQVLRNLLVNALRHTPPGGSVTVSTRQADGMAEIAIIDTGVGIDAEDLPHVFDRFWRADRSRSRQDRAQGGSGLGLSVAQSIIETHGGRIWAESIVGKGSAFRFTLPLAK